MRKSNRMRGRVPLAADRPTRAWCNVGTLGQAPLVEVATLVPRVPSRVSRRSSSSRCASSSSSRCKHHGKRNRHSNGRCGSRCSSSSNRHSISKGSCNLQTILNGLWLAIAHPVARLHRPPIERMRLTNVHEQHRQIARVHKRASELYESWKVLHVRGSGVRAEVQ